MELQLQKSVAISACLRQEEMGTSESIFYFWAPCKLGNIKRKWQMAKNHRKRCSTSLISREMQIKTTMRFHLTQIRMAIIKKSTND